MRYIPDECPLVSEEETFTLDVCLECEQFPECHIKDLIKEEEE